MRSGRARSVRFIDQRCDVGARIAKRCRTQTNVRVVLSAVLLFAAVVTAPFASRTLVYAAEPTVVEIDQDNKSINVSNGTFNAYKSLYLSHDDVLKYFGSGEDLTFSIDSCTLNSWSIDGASSASIRDTAADNFIIRATPASGGSQVSTSCKLGEQVTLSYGGSGLYITCYPAIGSYVNSAPSTGFRGIKYNARWKFTIPAKPLSDNEALNEIVDQNNKFHQEELDKGEQSGSDASQMVQDLTDQVKSKWEILFYPIEFTKKFLALFTSGSAGSTSLTFPAFSLEVQGSTYQVWEEYTYDLSSLKSQFSILFTGLHMVVGVIEVSWFIKYLYRKYDEVFGGESS